MIVLENLNPTTSEEGFHPESLSNEVLKLKIDDLFQEIETLKRRVELLEGQQGKGLPMGETRRIASDPARAGPVEGVISDPDRR